MKKILVLLTVATAFAACKKSITYKASDVPTDWAGLPALPADSGIQLHVPAFPIPANFEREWFMRKDLKNPEEIYVNRIYTKCRPGTHHLVMQELLDQPGFPIPEENVMIDQNNFDGSFNLFSSINNQNIIYEAQTAEEDFTLPEGYGLRFPANYKFNLNSHYFNKTNSTRFGEVYANLYTLQKKDVKQILDNGLLDGNENLVLPPNAETTLENKIIFDKKTTIMVMFPHYHKRGKKFEVQIVGGARNGEVILTSYDYQHPVVAKYVNAPLVLNAGEGLKSIVTYNNETNSEKRFGVTSEDEMNFLFFYYFNS